MGRLSTPPFSLARLLRRAEARRAAVAVAALAAAGPAGPAVAQGPIPQGGEFRVNTYTTIIQGYPSVDADAGGDFVVAWESGGQDGSQYGVYAQRYAASGAPVGPEFQVNTYTTAFQVNPSVAVDADGDFVVAWQSERQDGSLHGVYARRYAASGAPVGAEFRVNTTATGSQGNPSVALDADGDFVVAWESIPPSGGVGQDGSSSGIFAQRYTASGAPVGGEFQVNTYTTEFQVHPSVAVDADGDFVVAWESYGQDGARFGVYARRYNAVGEAQGDGFQVNTTTTSNERDPVVAVDADGDFVVVWDSQEQDGSEYGVYAQRYAASGAPVGGEFLVNTYTTSYQFGPAVAMDADGDVVVAWGSYAQEGEESDYGVYTQRYEGPNRPVASGGTPAGAAGGEVTVAGGTATQTAPSVATDADGDYVVAWTSTGRDASGLAVVAQRYDAAGVAQGAEFVVNTVATGDQQDPSVGMDADGDFVVAWEGTGQGFSPSTSNVYARRYNAAGVAQGAEFGVQFPGSIARTDPSVAMDADGDFVIAWQTSFQDGAVGFAVVAQRYNAAGELQGGQFVVNTFSTGDQSAPSVSLDADG
ncbi:MAG TPA: hypothetical protein VF576_00210, partial [Rubricoccaceae bacterium]